MNCIRCHVRMIKSEKEGVLVDQCPKCKGVWLDAGELDMIEHVQESKVVTFFQDLLKGLSQK